MQEKSDRIITIKNCDTVVLNGVDHIVGFDERCVILACDFGRVVIEGENMKVESLEKNGGEISVIGKFKGVYMSEEKKGDNSLKKLFKW